MNVPVVAVVVGLAGGYVASVVSGAGSATWKVLERELASWWQRRRQRRATAGRAREAAASVREEAELRSRLERERVGTRFVRRYTADDPGTILTVIELGRQDWRRQVAVKEVAPEGRPPTEFDHELLDRVSMDWSALTRSEAEQRHNTARMVRSYDDADGWIEFERVA